MPFLSTRPAEARTPEIEVLPDQRMRITRYFRLTQTGEIPYGLTTLPGTPDPWPETAPSGFTGLFLTYKKLSDNTPINLHGGKDIEPWVELIYEQIALTGETSTGGMDVTDLTDGRTQAVDDWVQFSFTPFVPQTINVDSVTAAGKTCYLFLEETDDDATLRKIKRTYQSPGITARDSESLQGGKLLKQSITSFHTVPTTPTGFTLVGSPVQNPLGYPIYTYTYYSADPAAGAGGETSRRYVDAQGGTTAFDPSSPASGAGAVRCIITYLTSLSVTADPTTGPASFVRVGVDFVARDGYKEWTVQYGFGSGLITDESTIISVAALVVYHRIQFGSAPSAPSATIGGTVTLFEDSTRNEDGFIVYERRWAEGDGQNSISTEGQADGALDYTVTTFTAAASTPSYPGSGTAYLVRLTQSAENAYSRNVALYRKPPATVTFKKQINFTKPGSVEFTGSPPQLVIKSQVTMTLLADAAVSYSTSQTTTAPFTVSLYAAYYANWIPYANPGPSPTPGSPPADPTTSAPRQEQASYGGYLAGASGISGTDDFFNGVFCQEYQAQLLSSDPSSFATPATYTLAVDNDPYLVDTSGTVVFRRTTTTYAFP